MREWLDEARGERDSYQEILFQRVGLVTLVQTHDVEIKPVTRWEPSRIRRARFEQKSRELANERLKVEADLEKVIS